MPRAWTITDLGFGDSGKGTCVEALTRQHKIPLVVKYCGGAQCAHHVVLEDGTTHCFSQFGSGTFSAAETLLGKNFLVDPYRLLNEREFLQLKGINPTIFVHEDALIITPYHQAINKLKELYRGKSLHGSCGVGIGETVRYSLKYPESALKVKDLSNKLIIKDKLATISKNLIDDLYDFTGGKVNNWEIFDIFTNKYVPDALMWRYHVFRDSVKIINQDITLDLISSKDTIWEGSQGVLLDEDYGFYPYVTWSQVTLRHAIELLDTANIKDRINIGVIRTYGHRHGAGPFPTEDQKISCFVKELHNTNNPWQSSFRVGWLDLVLLRHGLNVVSGRVNTQLCPINSLALTHLDRSGSIPEWKAAASYGINPDFICDPQDFKKREKLSSLLNKINVDDCIFNYLGKNQSISNFISSHLGLPIALESWGPTFKDKIFKN